MKLSEALEQHPELDVEVFCAACKKRLKRHRVTDFEGDWVQLDWGRGPDLTHPSQVGLKPRRVMRQTLDPDPRRWFRYEFSHKDCTSHPQYNEDRFGRVEAEVGNGCIVVRV